MPLEDIRLKPNVKVIIVRLKRTRGLDGTSAMVLTEVAMRMRDNGQRLLLVGLREPEMDWLRSSGCWMSWAWMRSFPRDKSGLQR